MNFSRRGVKMASSNIKARIPGELRKVWELVLDIENYGAWRSDLSKTEVISDKQFIEYTKDGYPTTFTVTIVEPYRRWEFDMENSNMSGHWTGVFADKGNETEIDFTEFVEAKKWFMKPFVKSYLKKAAGTVCGGYDEKLFLNLIHRKAALGSMNI